MESDVVRETESHFRLRFHRDFVPGFTAAARTLHSTVVSLSSTFYPRTLAERAASDAPAVGMLREMPAFHNDPAVGSRRPDS
jgi:hypothetical protein